MVQGMTHTEECNLGNSILSKPEIWKSLDGYISVDGYQLSSWGRVRKINGNGVYDGKATLNKEGVIRIRHYGSDVVRGKRRNIYIYLNKPYEILFGIPVTLPIYDKSTYCRKCFDKRNIGLSDIHLLEGV